MVGCYPVSLFGKVRRLARILVLLHHLGGLLAALEPAPIGKPDRFALGLLVSPQRLVLEPAQRRVVRVAAVGECGSTDKVYRVAIKPVAGQLSAGSSALKVLVGYDALVLLRPKVVTGGVTAIRQRRRITFHNASNTAQEIYDGKQCVATQPCARLPAKCVYAVVDWSVDLPVDAPVEFTVSDGTRSRRAVFP